VLFNSFQFLLFLPVVVCGYFLLPQRFRWVLLLGASWYFYMCWRMEYILLLLFSTLVDYLVGLRMAALPDKRSRGRWLWLSIGLNMGMLFLFKYFDFFSGALRQGFEAANIMVAVPELKLLLPVGISFYTFQSLTYTVDIYRGELKPERHFGRFALYIAFWPQLVAGPIERAATLLPQFHERHRPNYDRIVGGLCLIAYGFFKKVVVADRCALYVDEVYGHTDLYNGWNLLMATFLFAIQIYCDFSGYTDIAIGSAKMMGYDLMTNFNRPYLSTSITEFWRRWHISLSTWFRDYIYIPMGGGRKGKVRGLLNAFFTFVLSGFWHGANWTFLAWGAFHGSLLVVERLLKGLFKGIKPPTSRWVTVPARLAGGGFTFALVCVGWIFFRAKDMHQVAGIWTKIAHAPSAPLGSVVIRDGMKNLGIFNFTLTFAAIGLLGLSYLLPRDLRLRRSLLFLLFTTIIILLLGRNAGNEFIYFQF
jgi:D-alanyl-lipoteichoic acid acyltransferase DltB (MBOAT superfamily)